MNVPARPPFPVFLLPLLRGVRSRAAWIAAILLAALAPATTRATTVIAPDFDSLVKQSDYIVRGVVTSVTSEWRENNGQRFISSRVTIDVKETIAGTPPQPLILQMVGGKVGKDTLTIEGAPRFVEGEEHILFVKGNGQTFYPLVAIMHGQYPIKKDEKNGAAYVARSNGKPLRNEAEVAQPLVTEFGPLAAAANSPSAPPALSPEDFSRRIRASREKSTK